MANNKHCKQGTKNETLQVKLEKQAKMMSIGEKNGQMPLS